MPKSKCPTKWKVAHDTKAEAEKHAASLRAKGARSQYAYRCPEGHWHVGSRSVRQHAHNLKRGGKRRTR